MYQPKEPSFRVGYSILIFIPFSILIFIHFFESLITDQSIFPLVIILLTLITISLGNIWILLRENWCWSLLGLKGLRTQYPLYRAFNPSSFAILTNAWSIPRYLISFCLASITCPCSWSLVFVVSIGKVPERIQYKTRESPVLFPKYPQFIGSTNI